MPTKRLFAAGISILGLGVVLALLVCLAPIDPEVYRPPAAPALRGVLAPDHGFQGLALLAPGQLEGPEDVEPVADGTLLTGTADGSIRRIVATPSGWRVERFAATGGRPLGLDRDATGTLWVADSQRGLLAVDPGGRVSLATDEAAGERIAFADDVDTAPDGRVYVSDATTRRGADALFLDNLEARPRGRLIEYDPGSSSTRVLLDRLYFANGVAVAADGSFVLVAETFRYRVRRHWLTGPRAGETEIFADNLPGFPDGVSSDGRGGFWLAIHSPRSELLDRVVHPHPWLARLVARLPQGLRPGPDPYGLVVTLDGEGRIVSSLHDPRGSLYPFVTSVEEYDGALLLGSVTASAIGRLELR